MSTPGGVETKEGVESPKSKAPTLGAIVRSGSKSGSFSSSMVSFLFGDHVLDHENIPKPLLRNRKLITDEDLPLLRDLLELDQLHVFEQWEDPGTNDEAKLAMIRQLHQLDAGYGGGLKAYITRSRELLAASRDGVNTLDGYVPSVPEGVSIDPAQDLTRYLDYENIGMAELSKCCFVLVAGGLGERLGYSGIKIELPSETLTSKCYLQLYVETLLALQHQHGTDGAEGALPLAIMVSDDTEALTEKLLHDNNSWGAHPGQITLIKQEKVPALVDSDAHIAVDGKYSVQSKPHGHGDVHVLLHKHGLAKKWAEDGREWVVFFQDTNGLAFMSLAATLGVSKNLELDVNSLTVPRAAKQEVGAIARLEHEDGRVITTNVEYNQLEPLLKASGHKKGDVAHPETGLSPFPGNINQLVFRLGPYAETLARTDGVMPEFVNPKYADAEKSKFSKPTRLECMMQDYPKLLDASAKVGFTQAPAWLAFSPCKNSIEKAQAAMQKNAPGACAATAEADQYEVARRLLRIVGCNVENCSTKQFGGIPVQLTPAIVMAPSFGTTLTQIRSKFPAPSSVRIGSGSALVLEGDVTINRLDLDGIAVFRAQVGGSVIVDEARMRNPGIAFNAVTGTVQEPLMIRGYKRRTNAEEECYLRTAGSGSEVHVHINDDDGACCACSIL